MIYIKETMSLNQSESLMTPVGELIIVTVTFGKKTKATICSLYSPRNVMLLL